MSRTALRGPLSMGEAVELMGRQARILSGPCEGDIVVLMHYVHGEDVVTVKWKHEPSGELPGMVLTQETTFSDGVLIYGVVEAEPMRLPLSALQVVD